MMGNVGVFGGGIWNEGRALLSGRTAVTNNPGQTGGGVLNKGPLVLEEWARVSRNTASGGVWGGISSPGTVRFSRDWRGTVCANCPDDWMWCAR